MADTDSAPKVRYEPYWVTYSVGGGGTYYGTSTDDARERATQDGKQATEAKILPYPASPIVWRPEGYTCPPFCYTPRECQGRTCCPKRRACDD